MNKKLNAGITGEFSKDELYKKYIAMHSRCERKSHPSYPNYGGRGIAVCEEWSGKDGFRHLRTLKTMESKIHPYPC